MIDDWAKSTLIKPDKNSYEYNKNNVQITGYYINNKLLMRTIQKNWSDLSVRYSCASTEWLFHFILWNTGKYVTDQNLFFLDY